MIPPGTGPDAANSASGFPQPPFSVEVLADLHADALPPDVAQHIWAHLDDDPHARSVLEALDRTVAQVAAAPVPPQPVPPSVTDLTNRTLAQIRAEVTATTDSTVVGLESGRSTRRYRGRFLALGAAAAAAVVAAVLVISIGILRTPEPATPIQAQPSPISTLDGSERATALSVLGRTDFAPFGSEAALRRCTRANRIADDTPLLGSGPVTLREKLAAVILLGTGLAGRFDALVVGRDCTTDNPSTIALTRIGG
ncbi:hypothetical protein AAFP30_04890 [Gordonia sp. CPCC 205515]|uniref:hypothetical protein n=1 Tax=Gordonia sp. CPCC 205515 TaxID=3140791 RepID=UPI003AF3D418